VRADVIHPGELDESLLARWREIVARREYLRSPCFAPEFALAIGACRPDARVGVLLDNQSILGFFAFQLGRFARARPLGLALSDYQGVVHDLPEAPDALDILRVCGLRSFAFDHMLAGDPSFAGLCESIQGSPVMDLSAGYDAYCKARRDAGSKQILKLGTLRRKLERERGEIRFERSAEPGRVLETLLRWKSEQCQRTGSVDIFSHAWTLDLAARILETHTPAFAGTLSALWLGDDLLAAHLGMRSDRVWHYWFPSYDHDYAKFSPGLLLLLEMARACEDLSLIEVDLGKGEAEYKKRLATGEVPLGEGLIETPGLVRSASRVLRALDSWAARTPWARPATIPGRLVRRIRYRRRLT